jgi:hypothetical protein
VKHPFLEAVGEPSSGRWLIRVICAGLSGNANFYSDAVLREAVPLFEGARVFAKSDAEHIKGDGKDVAKLIGGLTKPRFVEGAAPDSGEIQAELVLIEAEGAVAVKLREAYSRDLAKLFGFSVDVSGNVKLEMREGKKVRVATKFGRVNSVDLIVEPGAGGELIRMIEAIVENPEVPVTLQEGDPMRTRMIEAIKAHNPTFDGAKATDEQIEIAYREALIASAKPKADTGDLAKVEERIRMIEARGNARATIAGAKLPQAAKDKLTADFNARERFVEADVTAAIEAERTYLAKFTESGKPVMHFDEAPRVEDRAEKMADMFDAFFNPAHKNHRDVHSFKECYIEFTGDKRVTGRLEHCDSARLRESMGARFREAFTTTALADALGDSIARRMIAVYEGEADLQTWRRVATTAPVSDFRTQERIRIGGYGNLPAVAQGADYQALASPGDDKATYAVSKRGGLETITLEAIKNDDVGVIRRVPTELALAAGWTLYEFVYDFFRTNPTIYDTTALYTAGHNNLYTAALDATAFAAHYAGMGKQVRSGSGKRLLAAPKTLLVPVDLRETAYNLFVRGQNNDKTFVQDTNPDVIVVPHWTDTNNWYTVADPNRLPVLEIGFLDGQEQPEIFVQDNPTVGSMFSADKLTWKIRHIYSGAVLVDGEKGTTGAIVP